MAQKKRRFDPKSPEIKAYLKDVHFGTFTREGTLVAFPTCFPGMTAPIVHDESHITALDTTPDGFVYGGTGGRQAHLFVATFHGLGGMVLDIGRPAGATGCAAVCCGGARVAAFVNGARGGRVVSAPLMRLGGEDLIQEWGFELPPLTDHGECVAGEPVVHAVTDAARKTAVGITAKHLFTVDLDAPKVQVVGEIAGTGRIAVASRGGVFGRDEGGTLWRYDAAARAIKRRAVKLPSGFGDAPLVWASRGRGGLLYTAAADGTLYSFDEDKGFSAPLGKTLLAPVGPMAVTFDGRVFGFCGDEIAKMFCYDPGKREVSNLGVAASVIERRRYGYVFGDAVTGRDGEIVFGEDDNGGHVWLYFPRVQERA
ncbi:MAG: hypothetical protein ACM336_21450 [Acidobacteriota bacterium]